MVEPGLLARSEFDSTLCRLLHAPDAGWISMRRQGDT